MHYLLDMQTSPPIVVKQLRDLRGEDVEVAQRYADQTKHTCVWAEGPDSVTDAANTAVVHPVGHAPAAPQPAAPAVMGVNVAPVSHHSAIAGDLSAVWELLKSLEPTAVDILFKMLGALISGKK